MPKSILKFAFICSLLCGTGCFSATVVEPESSTKERIETPPVGNGGLATCALFFRDDAMLRKDGARGDDSFAKEEMLIAPGERKSVSLGFLELHGDYSYSPIDVGAFHLSATTNEARLFSTLYQFSASKGPSNQFGSHGFTGLIYLTHPTNGGNYQAWCRWVSN